MIKNYSRFSKNIINAILVIQIIAFIIQFLNGNTYKLISPFNLYISILSNILIFVLIFPYIIKKDIKVVLLVLIIYIIILANSILISNNFGSIIIIMYLIAIFISFPYYKINIKTIKLILLFMFIYIIVYNFISHLGLNLNTQGYVYLLLCIYSTLYFDFNKKLNIFNILVILITLYQVQLSESRGALIGLIIFLILRYIISAKLWSNKIVYNLIIFILTTGAIIFASIYVYMWKNNVHLDISFSSKNLYSGREAIWDEAFILIKQFPWTGIGSAYKIQSYSNFNIHNSMLNLVLVYGIPVYIFIVSVITIALNKIRKYIVNDKRVKTIIAGFFAILQVGFFENNLVWPATSYCSCLLIGIAFSLINQKYEENINEEEV